MNRPRRDVLGSRYNNAESYRKRRPGMLNALGRYLTIHDMKCMAYCGCDFDKLSKLRPAIA